MNTATFYGTGGWGRENHNMKPLFWNKKKGKLQSKPPLTIPEKLLVVIMIPVLLMAAYAIGSKIIEGKRQGLSFTQIINK